MQAHHGLRGQTFPGIFWLSTANKRIMKMDIEFYLKLDPNSWNPSKFKNFRPNILFRHQNLIHGKPSTVRWSTYEVSIKGNSNTTSVRRLCSLSGWLFNLSGIQNPQREGCNKLIRIRCIACLENFENMCALCTPRVCNTNGEKSHPWPVKVRAKIVLGYLAICTPDGEWKQVAHAACAFCTQHCMPNLEMACNFSWRFTRTLETKN